MKVEGKISQQINGTGYFARVIMKISSSDYHAVEFKNVTGWETENDIVHPSWIEGAKVGAEFALNTIHKNQYIVSIKQILGTICDTNPTIIGFASILGIWNNLGSSPTKSEIHRLNDIMLNSWSKSYDSIPIF